MVYTHSNTFSTINISFSIFQYSILYNNNFFGVVKKDSRHGKTYNVEKIEDDSMYFSGSLNTRQEVIEFNFIKKIIIVSIRSRYLGKEARKRMLDGDYTNKPEKKVRKEPGGYQ
jgi:hypothetical protein